MKILWLINVPLPVLAKDAGLKVVPFGGWLVRLAAEIIKYPDIELYVLFKQTENEKGVYGETQGIKYCGFYQDVFTADEISDNHREVFRTTIEEYSPDIIQIFGTEHLHSYVMMEICKELHMESRVIVTIQGLISVYAKHYFADIPLAIRYGYSIRDIGRGNVNAGRLLNIKKGRYEEAVIASAKNIIGRTEWDEACSKRLNPDVNYYCNNETLRESFYHARWNYDRCNKHQIFCSQASYPIKGIHHMLDALTEIVVQYPDTVLTISGDDFTSKPSIKQSLYQKYLIKKIERNGLKEHVRFLGQLQEQEMRDAYLAANVFVCPSSIENSPNSLGEAMLLGMPVVSADVGGVKSMLQHGTEGYIYPHDETYMLAYYVKKIFAMGEDAVQIGNAAHEHASRTHNVSTNVQQLYTIYHKLV